MARWASYSSGFPTEFPREKLVVERLLEVTAVVVKLPQRLALKQRSLDSLVWHGGGAIAVMTLRESDFAETGATSDETEGLVNEPFVVGAAEVSILLVEAPGLTRVSLRSRGAVDVADLARKFGGGGHVRAAGIKTPEPLDAFCTTLLAAIEKKGL